MATLVSLRRHRKRRSREAARAEADAAAARHGEAKPVRALSQARTRLEARRLDGHRREGSDAGSEGDGEKE